jgi:hypothetical protein
VPDVLVVPTPTAGALAHRADLLEAYTEPLPPIVDIWSPSTGGYDIEENRAEYWRRSDLEISRIHPFQRTVTVWRR